MPEPRLTARLYALTWMVAEGALRVNPSAAFLVLRAAWRLGFAPPVVAPEHLREVLPELTGEAACQAAMRANWLELKLRGLAQLRRRGGTAAIQRHIRLHDETGLIERASTGVPTILLAWHYGGTRFLGPALSGRGLRLLVVRHANTNVVSAGTSEVLTGPGGGRALAMGTAVAHLRAGGSVLLAADGVGKSLRVPCLGRRLALSRGAFAMARLCGAPILPVVALASHGGPGLELLIQPPLYTDRDPSDPSYERTLARQAARRIAASFAENPGEVRPALLGRLRRSPLVETVF